MPWYHRIAAFLNYSLPQLRSTRRTNLARLTVAILEGRALAISVLARAWRVELPYSHHQRKKRLSRFRSNTGFDTVAAQTALLAPICQGARLRGLAPIMIDWSDLGQGRNGLFSRSGTAPAQLGVHTGRVGPVPEPGGGVLHRSVAASPAHQPPASAFGRPRLGTGQLDPFGAAAAQHTSYPVDYVIRPKGDVVVQNTDYRGRLRDYTLRKGRILFWPQTLYRSDGAVVINLVLYWA